MPRRLPLVAVVPYVPPAGILHCLNLFHNVNSISPPKSKLTCHLLLLSTESGKLINEATKLL